MSDSVLAEVSETGLLVFHERDKWDRIVRAHKGRLVRVSMERAQPTRSNQANRRYFGVIVPVCQSILSQGRALPLSKKQVHYVLKRAFLDSVDTDLGPAPLDSRDLSVPAFAEFMEKVEAHFRSEYGAVFPESTEAA